MNSWKGRFVKTWEELHTSDEIRIFEALFTYVSTRFGLRTIEKCFENQDFIFCSSFQNLRLGSIKLLQKIIASQKTNTSHHIACYYLCNHLAKLLQKIMASQKTQHITSHVATIFCDHLAKSSQKIIASQKTNTSHHIACYYLCNHLAKFMLPKWRFWNAEQKIGSIFSMNFSMVSCPNLVLTSVKSTSKRPTQSFVRPSKSSFGRHKVVTKDHGIPENQHIASYSMLLSFVIILQSRHKRS